MKILLIAVAVYCFTACGVKEKKDAALRVVNNSDEEVKVSVTGNYEVEDVSRELTIPPHFTANHNWEYKTKKKSGNDLSGDSSVEVMVRRPNKAVLMWKKYSNMSGENLILNIVCDNRNCAVE